MCGLVLFYTVKQIFNLMLSNIKGVFGGLQKIVSEFKKISIVFDKKWGKKHYL